MADRAFACLFALQIHAGLFRNRSCEACKMRQNKALRPVLDGLSILLGRRGG